MHLALTGLLEFEPDIVVSGINNVANLGDDVIYSGTVSAAMEGRFLGLPWRCRWSAATTIRSTTKPLRAAVEIVARLKADPLPADTILNVNVPDLPWSEVKGFEVTRLGNRHRAEGCIAQKDPRGNEVYWIGPAGREQDSGPGTDFHAVRTGHISITPIQVDLTRYQALEKVASWVSGLRSPGPAGMSPRLRLQPEAVGIGMTSQRVRDRLVDRLREAGIVDEPTLNAIRVVPRHLFIDEALASRAYEDTALPIGHGQTISQPWVVARMTEAVLQVAPKRVLEVGTGSGYQPPSSVRWAWRSTPWSASATCCARRASASVRWA